MSPTLLQPRQSTSVGFTRATKTLPHHRFSHSLGGPLLRVFATIEQIESAPGYHNGANHQHLILSNITVDYDNSQGLPDNFQAPDRVFVAIRFGDDEGLNDPISFTEGTSVRMQGEYIDAADAYPTQDNPGLAVLHFTHHPVGFVEYPAYQDGRHGTIYS